MDAGGFDYWLISHKDAKSPIDTIGGLYNPQGMPLQGIVNYFNVKSLDESLKHASSLGATVVVPKQEIGRGHFAILKDPDGNTFALFQANSFVLVSER